MNTSERLKEIAERYFPQFFRKGESLASQKDLLSALSEAYELGRPKWIPVSPETLLKPYEKHWVWSNVYSKEIPLLGWQDAHGHWYVEPGYMSEFPPTHYQEYQEHPSPPSDKPVKE